MAERSVDIAVAEGIYPTVEDVLAELPSEGVFDKPPRERTAVGQSELLMVQEMARCLGELKAGRWPK